MTVQQLIEKLQKCDPNATVLVWEAGRDRETNEVHVSILDGKVFVDSTVIGREVK